jgi:hypothetical protein
VLHWGRNLRDDARLRVVVLPQDLEKFKTPLEATKKRGACR